MRESRNSSRVGRWGFVGDYVCLAFRLELVGYSAPGDGARERSNDAVVEEKGRGYRPKETMDEYARSICFFVSTERQVRGSCADCGLRRAENIDDDCEKERPLINASRVSKRNCQQQAGHYDSYEESVSRQGGKP